MAETAKRKARPLDERVTELRVSLRDIGHESKHIPNSALGRLIEHVGDVGVATDAVLMERRPRWLRDIIGLN